MGKDFAVVAEEVRKLAEKSKVVAERISTVVSNVQGETVQIVDAITTTSEVLEEGRKIANNAQTSFYQIVEGIKVISHQVDLVSSASEEIAATFKDVALLSKQTSSRVDSMAHHATEQVAIMGEMGKSVNSLFKVSNELQETTGKYKL